MSVSTIERLRHIRDEIEFIAKTCASREKLNVLSDDVAQRAVIRSLELIGEAAKPLPTTFRESHPETDWRKVRRDAGSVDSRILRG